MNTTSQRLNYLVKDFGLSNNGFAASVGVSKSIISRILNGKCEPTVETLRKIVKVTKTSPEWILGYGDDTPIKKLDI